MRAIAALGIAGFGAGLPATLPTLLWRNWVAVRADQTLRRERGAGEVPLTNPHFQVSCPRCTLGWQLAHLLVWVDEYLGDVTAFAALWNGVMCAVWLRRWAASPTLPGHLPKLPTGVLPLGLGAAHPEAAVCGHRHHAEPPRGAGRTWGAVALSVALPSTTPAHPSAVPDAACCALYRVSVDYTQAPSLCTPPGGPGVRAVGGDPSLTCMATPAPSPALGAQLRHGVLYLTRAASARTLTKSLNIVIDFSMLVGIVCMRVVRLPAQGRRMVGSDAKVPLWWMRLWRRLCTFLITSTLILMLGMVFSSRGLQPGTPAYQAFTAVTAVLVVSSCFAFLLLLVFEVARSPKVRRYPGRSPSPASWSPSHTPTCRTPAMSLLATIHLVVLARLLMRRKSEVCYHYLHTLVTALPPSPSFPGCDAAGHCP